MHSKFKAKFDKDLSTKVSLNMSIGIESISPEQDSSSRLQFPLHVSLCTVDGET
jgi:hypothetical protein